MVLDKILIMILIFLGLPVGIILAKLSPEEMKTGNKYFRLMQAFLLIFMLFFLFQYFRLSLIISLIISVLVFLILLYVKVNSIIFYLLFPLIIYFSHENIYLFAIESSLMFIFGLATGSLLSKTKRKKFVCKFKDIMTIILQHSIFLPLAFLAILV